MFGFDLTFFDIIELSEYDMILGKQGLTQMKTTLNFSEYEICYHKPREHKINYDYPNYEKEISQIMKQNENISETLPFTTTIQATIRTKNEEPIYVKQYPYPYADKEFVDVEIQKLLKNGIIDHS